MHCTGCGAPVADDSAFCQKCGKPTAPASVCPGCGVQVDGSASYCDKCGAALTAPAGSSVFTSWVTDNYQRWLDTGDPQYLSKFTKHLGHAVAREKRHGLDEIEQLKAAFPKAVDNRAFIGVLEEIAARATCPTCGIQTAMASEYCSACGSQWVRQTTVTQSPQRYPQWIDKQSAYYREEFRRFHDNPSYKGKFNWSAFLFNAFWLLSRDLPGAGAGLLALGFLAAVLSVPTAGISDLAYLAVGIVVGARGNRMRYDALNVVAPRSGVSSVTRPGVVETDDGLICPNCNKPNARNRTECEWCWAPLR